MTNSLKAFANCKSEIVIGANVTVFRFIPSIGEYLSFANGEISNIVKHNQHGWRLEFTNGKAVEVSSKSRIQIS